MSVTRGIEIRLLSNVFCLSALLNKLTVDFWNLKNENGTFTSIPLEDNGNFDWQEFNDIEAVYHILDKREADKKINAIGFWDKDYTESLSLLIYSLHNNYEGFNKHYLFCVRPDTAKRIEGAPRCTDYGYYLNQILPKLISLDCYICEVKCHDFDC